MNLRMWADVALVFLLAQVFIVGVSLAIALFYTLRAATILDRQLRISLPLLRNRADRMAVNAAQAGDEIRAPIIAASSRLAQAQRILDGALSAIAGK